RHEISKVICSLCNKEQDVQQNCSGCGACMGKYFCEKCNFFDDDISKKQYHCDGCGICRTGGIDNFFHCEKCGVLLQQCFEGLSSLCGTSNASQLPCLLRGTYLTRPWTSAYCTAGTRSIWNA
uniref:CTCHY-type domain-containing protein n=1 Tax=Aegilops tauschii subsp. strangulata TaxID=200361 RepID=A0A452YBT1_AEGTS